MNRAFSRQAFTLVEILVVTAIMSVILGIAAVALRDARTNASIAQGGGVARNLNEIAMRARFEYLDGAGTHGSDKDAALTWYQNAGFVDRPVDIVNVDFVNGIWLIDLN